MSNIKLQVGKTYRNRKGEEVKIVEYNGDSEYPYGGSDSEWYTESGRFEYFTKSPEDLIEEVPEIRHTFAIADGIKTITIEQVGNRIVLEMVPEEAEPKPGDVMINEYDSVYIFKRAIDDHSHECYAWLGKNRKVENLLIGGWDFSGRPATPEEAQPLFDTLQRAGKQWNPQTMQVEDVKPKPGDVMINEKGSVYILKDVVDNGNHRYFAWFRKNEHLSIEGTCLPGHLATPEEAQTLWDALKKAGKQWNAETMQIEDIGPKPGDIMINKFGSLYIFKKVYDDGWHNNFVWVDNNGRAFYNNTSACFPGRLATLEEAKLLFDALKKAGKRWNAETMQVEDIGPRPGDVMINENGSVYIFKDVVDNGNHRYFAWFGKDGRLFIEGTCLPGRSATPEETKLLFDALKKEGKQWNPKTMEIEDVPEIDHIRKWVEKHLDYRYYNHESLTKVIYNYLKHKEGENER
jgi:signal peptidase I